MDEKHGHAIDEFSRNIRNSAMNMEEGNQENGLSKKYFDYRTQGSEGIYGGHQEISKKPIGGKNEFSKNISNCHMKIGSDHQRG